MHLPLWPKASWAAPRELFWGGCRVLSRSVPQEDTGPGLSGYSVCGEWMGGVERWGVGGGLAVDWWCVDGWGVDKWILDGSRWLGKWSGGQTDAWRGLAQNC